MLHRVREGPGGGENCKVFSKSRHPEVTDGNYEYHHRLCVTVPRIFSQDYNSNEISVFKEPNSHSSPERSTPAYGQNYRVQDNKVGGGGGLVSFVSKL